jgi:imidazolonepropionase-like amidohydrolase
VNNPSVKILTLFAFILVVLISCTTNNDFKDASYAINNVTVIDAKNGTRDNQTLIVKDNKIIALGTSDELSFSDELKLIDGKGKYLIPGLWDAHVHLTYEPEMTTSMFDLFLVNGITSVRDTGGELELVMPLKREADADPKNKPRVKVAGPLLDGVPTVYDGVSRIKLGMGAGTPAAAEALVDQFVDGGVDLIKSYEMLTPASFSAVLKRAKQHGKIVTGHVPLSMDVVDASNQGLRSMEHMRNLEMSISEDHDSLLKVRKEMLFNKNKLLGLELRSSIHSAQRTHAILTQDETRRNYVLKVLHDNDTWQTPTLSIVTPRAFRPFAKQSWRDNFKYLPTNVEERWNELVSTITENPVNESDYIFPNWAMEMVSHLKAAKVPIMAGTDTPIFLLTPGFSLHNELVLLVQAGLTPMEALESATYLPAQYFGLEKELGLIEEGMLADLLLLNANPLESIDNTQNIDAVFKDGKYFNRSALNKILSELN